MGRRRLWPTAVLHHRPLSTLVLVIVVERPVVLLVLNDTGRLLLFGHSRPLCLFVLVVVVEGSVGLLSFGLIAGRRRRGRAWLLLLLLWRQRRWCRNRPRRPIVIQQGLRRRDLVDQVQQLDNVTVVVFQSLEKKQELVITDLKKA